MHELPRIGVRNELFCLCVGLFLAVQRLGDYFPLVQFHTVCRMFRYLVSLWGNPPSPAVSMKTRNAEAVSPRAQGKTRPASLKTAPNHGALSSPKLFGTVVSLDPSPQKASVSLPPHGSHRFLHNRHNPPSPPPHSSSPSPPQPPAPPALLQTYACLSCC